MGYQQGSKKELQAIEILRLLIDSGFEAYFVGGCVRDQLCGRDVQDYDIATSAEPQQVLRLFPHTTGYGMKHGTVAVIVDGSIFEVTTFRKEAEYEQHRRPAKVEFIADLLQDLARRDFTINAMAMNVSGELVDPFGGANDLQNHLLR